MKTLLLSQLLSERRQDRDPVARRGGEAISYARFAAEAAGLAAEAQASGWRRAALLAQDSYRFALGLFGLMHGGCEVVLPPNHQPGTIEAMRGGFDLVVDDARLSEVRPREDRLDPLDAENCALAFFTSGSTGMPKRILKSLAMFEREAQTLNALWGGEDGGEVFATVPHQHVYGLSFKIMAPLAAGRPFHAETPEVWETLLAGLTSNAVIVSSPAHLGRMAGLSALPADRRPSRVFSAGAPLSTEAAHEARRVLGVLPTEIFGSTETGAIATRQQESGEAPWRLLPGLGMRTDRNGRLSLLTPFVGDEWIETADLVAPVGDGFRLLGRADRVVKIEGRRVDLNAMEEALVKLPEVAAAVVIWLPGEDGRLGAAIVPSAEGRAQMARLGKFRFGRLLRAGLADKLEPASAPRLWRFVEALPSAELGKRRDRDILELFTDAQ
ncbi:AMP-fatty acid ligase [Hypericibacter terrae]|uniref:AMP-fatty acid ligase n=1 Tax=Hypericibacter terrae TaxID=2602015 RepID=A0A5J6MHC4_9PROT|nr:AMP-binding protein [Hypericibacter terrae]QEX16491.1 AMP-fatty acid ligase [Hypericibacter terrae]